MTNTPNKYLLEEYAVEIIVITMSMGMIQTLLTQAIGFSYWVVVWSLFTGVFIGLTLSIFLSFNRKTHNRL